MFLFSEHHEELVGVYASQLARHRCIDLFVHMMELRLNSRCQLYNSFFYYYYIIDVFVHMVELRLDSASYIIYYFIFYYIATVFSPSLPFFFVCVGGGVVMIESMLQLVHVTNSSVTVYLW